MPSFRDLLQSAVCEIRPDFGLHKKIACQCENLFGAKVRSCVGKIVQSVGVERQIAVLVLLETDGMEPIDHSSVCYGYPCQDGGKFARGNQSDIVRSHRGNPAAVWPLFLLRCFRAFGMNQVTFRAGLQVIVSRRPIKTRTIGSCIANLWRFFAPSDREVFI